MQTNKKKEYTCDKDISWLLFLGMQFYVKQLRQFVKAMLNILYIRKTFSLELITIIGSHDSDLSLLTIQ